MFECSFGILHKMLNLLRQVGEMPSHRWHCSWFLSAEKRKWILGKGNCTCKNRTGKGMGYFIWIVAAWWVVVFRGWEVKLVRWAWGQIVPTLRSNEGTGIYSVGIGGPWEGQHRYKMIVDSGKDLSLKEEEKRVRETSFRLLGKMR